MKIKVVLICAKQYIEEYSAHATEGIFLINPSAIEEMAAKLEIILVIQKLKYSTNDDARSTLVKMLKKSGANRSFFLFGLI